MALSIFPSKRKTLVIGADAPVQKKGVSAPKKAAGIDPDDDLAIGKWYLQQAREFEKNKRESERRDVKIAWRVAGAAVGFALVALIGTVSLALLKRPNPPAVLEVDHSTGKVTVLPTTATGHVTWDEKSDRADLHRYVEARESYDWETINDMYGFVSLESDDHEKALYDAEIRGPRGPLKILKDQFRVIATVSVITFVGDTAQVFFSKQAVPLNAGSMRPDPEYWIATISYKRVDVPENTDAQDLDPDGVRVVSYRVDRDWTRTPAPTPQAGVK
jgi:type IV secretion system protein VirB8